MSETRAFHIGDILSVTDGTLVSPEHIGGVYKLLGWLVDEDLMTHQLPRVSRECEPFLREQFPDLAAISIPRGAVTDEATMWTYLASLEPTHGTHREVPRLPSADHTPIGPLTELRMIRPDAEVIVIQAPEPS